MRGLYTCLEGPSGTPGKMLPRGVAFPPEMCYYVACDVYLLHATYFSGGEYLFRYHAIGPRAKQLNTLTDQWLRPVFEDLELTPAQSRVLGFLIARKDNPCCPRDVEEAFALTHPTVSGILSRLEEKGFLTFHADDTDRRCKRLRPTEKAFEVHARMESAFDRVEDQMTQGITPEELEQFSALLDQVIRNLGAEPCHFPKEEFL